jgi:hypothetical protein
MLLHLQARIERCANLIEIHPGIGHERVWCCFSLAELEKMRASMGLPIERDLYFKPGSFSQVVSAVKSGS